MRCIHTVDVEEQSTQLAINRTDRFSNCFSCSVRMEAETDTAFSSPNTWIVDVEGGFCAPTTDLFRDIKIDFETTTRIPIGIAGYGYSTCWAFIVKIRSLIVNFRIYDPQTMCEWKRGSSFDGTNEGTTLWGDEWITNVLMLIITSWLVTVVERDEIRWLKRKTETPHTAPTTDTSLLIFLYG